MLDCVIGLVNTDSMRMTTRNGVVVGLLSNGKFNFRDFSLVENNSEWQCHGNIFPSESKDESFWLEIIRADYVIKG